jgi:Matrixin
MLGRNIILAVASVGALVSQRAESAATSYVSPPTQTYKIHSGIPANCQTSIKNAAAVWNAANTKYQLVFGGNYSTKFGKSFQSFIFIEGAAPSDLTTPSDGGVTTRRYGTYDTVRKMHPFDTSYILINETKLAADFHCDWSTKAPALKFDFGDIIMHEFGHAAGLEHNNTNAANIMIYLPSVGKTNHVLTAADKADILALMGSK